MFIIFDPIRNLLKEGRDLVQSGDLALAKVRYAQAAAIAINLAQLRDRGRLSLLPEELQELKTLVEELQMATKDAEGGTGSHQKLSGPQQQHLDILKLIRLELEDAFPDVFSR